MTDQTKPKRIKQQLELLNGVRQSGESDSAVIACNDWLRLGSGRSMPKLLAYYQDKTDFVREFAPPSRSYKTLGTWSSRYDWPSRAREYDAAWETRKNAEREATLNCGLALDYERLNELYRLAAFLKAQIYERGKDGVYHNIWMPDVKSIGSGEFAERVDIERFNGPLIEEYRKVLEDIAKEVGGRIQKTDVTSGGEKIPSAFEVKVIDYRASIAAIERRPIPDSNPSSED